MSVQSRSSARWAAARIVLFYVGFLGLLAAALWYFPAFRDLITFEMGTGTSDSAAGEITRTFAGDEPLEREIPSGWESIWVTGVSVVGALLIMVPVAWTYILIKRESGYEESVVHTLLILPVAVTGIVTIVQTSLALAFSLAGIVAAVRFRTTLDDTKDAVYVFLAIGVGLAAGVQALGVALALSVAFNVVNLALWKLNFGNIYADQLHRTGGLGLGTVIAGPGSSKGAIGFGDRAAAAESLAPESLAEVTRTQDGIRRRLHKESSQKKERKQYSALLVYSRDVEGARELVEPVLDERCARWQLAQVVPGERDGVSAMTWLVRLNHGIADSFFMEAVQLATEGPNSPVDAAELRTLKALAQD